MKYIKPNVKIHQMRCSHPIALSFTGETERMNKDNEDPELEETCDW